MKPDKINAIFTILMAAIIAISIKIVGLLLITGMLIIPSTNGCPINSWRTSISNDRIVFIFRI